MMKSILLVMSFIFFTHSYSLADTTIEHQIRLCENESSLLQKLQLSENVKDKIKHKNFQVYYLENPSRQFQHNNWSIRFRDKGNKVELTVKKRLDPSQTPRGIKDLICEYDLHGSEKEYSCKIDEDLDPELFHKILSHKMDWTEGLNNNQKLLLQQFNGIYEGALIYGILEGNRYQWDDSRLGEITLDLIHLKNSPHYMFNEVSMRYDQSKSSTMGSLFEKKIQSIGFTRCSNQIDWPVNKFDIFEVIN